MPVSSKIIMANAQNCKVLGDNLKTIAIDDLWSSRYFSFSFFVAVALNYRISGGQEDAWKMPMHAYKAHL